MVKDENDSFATATEILSKKWSLVIVYALLDGEKRFSELERSIKDISPKVLALTLNTLQRYGIIERRVEDTSPVRVKYRLTEKGRDLGEIVREIKKWSERWDNF